MSKSATITITQNDDELGMVTIEIDFDPDVKAEGDMHMPAGIAMHMLNLYNESRQEGGDE